MLQNYDREWDVFNKCIGDLVDLKLAVGEKFLIIINDWTLQLKFIKMSLINSIYVSEEYLNIIINVSCLFTNN